MKRTPIALVILNAIFITIPVLFVVYQALFPLIYFLLIFITRDDNAMFFYGYWISELLCVAYLSRQLYRLFQKKTNLYKITTPITLIVFTIFGINIFPKYSHFPLRTSRDIQFEDSIFVAREIAHATNRHPNPLFYNTDKQNIERAFKKCFDTITRREYYGNEEDMNNIFFAFLDKKYFDSILKISVDTMFYDNTYNKIFALVIYEHRSGEYAGKAFLGYRVTSNNSIKLFSYDYVCSETEKLTRQQYINFSLRKYFLTDIRDNVQGLDYGTTVKFMYCPLDKEFWTGPLYTKGPTIDSLYYFETDIYHDIYHENAGRSKLRPFLLVWPQDSM